MTDLLNENGAGKESHRLYLPGPIQHGLVRLLGGEAAVHDVLHTGDVGGFVAGQEEDQL